MTYYEHILSLLPHHMQTEENASNIKKILKVFAKYLDEEKKSDDLYSNLLSVDVATGAMLDLLGDMFYIYRKQGETDDEFRKRIIYIILSRKNGNTLPSIIQTVNSLVQTGKLTVHENYDGSPANIYLSGHATTQEFNYVYDVVIEILPAGIRLIIPIIKLGTWQDILDIAGTWGNLANHRYIW